MRQKNKLGKDDFFFCDNCGTISYKQVKNGYCLKCGRRETDDTLRTENRSWLKPFAEPKFEIYVPLVISQLEDYKYPILFSCN